MRRCLVRIPLLLAAAALVVLPAQAADRSIPAFDAVKQIVERELAKRPNFQRGDVISRGDVEPIFDQLNELGWRPGDIEELYDAFLPEAAALVVTLRTEAGRRLMRQVGHLPGIYDRLERLSWLADGTKRLRQLAADPKAAEIAQRWTTPAGAQEMQSRLASDPRGANFALPTGHIHTVDELLAHLKKSHAAALRSRSPAAN